MAAGVAEARARPTCCRSRAKWRRATETERRCVSPRALWGNSRRRAGSVELFSRWRSYIAAWFVAILLLLSGVTLRCEGNAARSNMVVSSCLAAPALTLSPASQTALAGTQVTYTVNLTNHDSNACGPTTFTLVRSVPAGWQSTFALSSLTLSPGATGTTTYSVTSPGSASSGTYGVWASVSAGSTSIHQASASGAYTISAGDIVGPTAPGALLATGTRRQVAAVWQAATDNIAVAGYRVFRNGALLATTAATSWTDQTATTGGPYTYSIVAFDGAGNVSMPSNTVTVTVPASGKK